MEADFERRFGGLARLYGEDTLRRFCDANVCVVGIGGVGSWAAEALARSAVGALTLIDLDHIAESNTNRQIHALGDEFGKAKVTAMAERIEAINPGCRISAIDAFVTPENVSELLNGFDVVIDAIDQVRTKVAMIAWCRSKDIPIVVAGSAGGQIDPTRIVAGDLAQTVQDPLLSKVRAQLRKHHGFARDPKRKFGVSAIYSTEPLRYPKIADSCAPAAGAGGLNCAGFGSSVCITATFGFFAAAAAMKVLSGD